MERTDEEFDRMITVDVLTKISEAFNVLACEMGLAPMYYRETTSNLLTKKAQETKKVICAYIDNLVDGYEKCHLKRSQLSDNPDSKCEGLASLAEDLKRFNQRNNETGE